MDFSPITSLIFDWLLSPFIWFALVLVFLIGTFGILWIRRRRKLIYELLELVDYGNGKSGFNLIKGGYFGKNKILRGWFDYGEDQMETIDGEPILNFSTEDFQEINGKRGVVVARDPVNQEILVPISKVRIKNQELLAEIAPAEYRDAALEIIKDADRETSDYTKQIIQWILIGATIIFALVSIIVIAQMVKNGQKEAANLIVQAGDTCLKNAKEVCSNLMTAAKSSAP